MAQKMTVEVEVFNKGRYDGKGWPPNDPLGFLAWFQERIESIPPEHRAQAKIEFGTYSRYDDTEATIAITYTRDETDAELEARLQREELAQQAKVTKEKEMLEKLLAKYGTP